MLSSIRVTSLPEAVVAMEATEAAGFGGSRLTGGGSGGLGGPLSGAGMASRRGGGLFFGVGGPSASSSMGAQ